MTRRSAYRANSWIIKADLGRCESRRFCRLIDLLVRCSERMVPRNNAAVWPLNASCGRFAGKLTNHLKDGTGVSSGSE